jgi:1-acyl-sn-glycerol-3-phosphate acyltransferase
LILIVVGIPVLVLGLAYPSRRIMAWAANLWARAMLLACGVRLVIEGAEAVSDGQPRFYLGNHQSALDIPVIICALRGDVRFMAKNSLFAIPIFGWILSRYGYVPVDRGHARRSHASLTRMVERLRARPISFAVFPEGTRSRDGRLQPFRKGTMKICRRSGLPVVPFSIDGTVSVHHRDEFLRARPGVVRLIFGRPIPSEEVAAMSDAELLERVRGVISAQLGLPADWEMRAPTAAAESRCTT